jgi:DNA mismatch endonuclease (patch repair protein)
MAPHPISQAGTSRPAVPAPSSPEARRRMLATRREDTAPERRLRSSLHRLGLRFRVHRPIVPGVRRKADIVFGPSRVAVFVDGCFWHSCPTHGTAAKANANFWRKKLRDNQRRDADTNARLKAAGWKVIRVWEHEKPKVAARRIAAAVRRRRSRQWTCSGARAR